MGSFEPDHTLGMPPRSHEIDPAVSVDVGRMDIGGSGLEASQPVPFPHRFRIFRGFPPGEPVSQTRRIGRTSLGGRGDIGSSVSVDISESQVVTESRRVPVGEHETMPGSGLLRIFRNPVPDQGIAERPHGLGAGGQQVQAPVPIHVTGEEPMNAVDLIVDQPLLPGIGLGVLRLLQPGDQARLVAGSDPVQVTVAVHVQGLAVDEVPLVLRPQKDLLPIGSHQQAGPPVAVGDDVG